MSISDFYPYMFVLDLYPLLLFRKLLYPNLCLINDFQYKNGKAVSNPFASLPDQAYL